MLSKYKIYFEKRNPNALRFDNAETGKMIHMIICPPIEKGCDIIKIGDDRNSGYIYNFEGFILITTKTDRKLYYKGDLLTQINR